VETWLVSTKAILSRAFGEPQGGLHEFTRSFDAAYAGEFHFHMSHAEMQQNHRATQALRKKLLESFVEHLRDVSPNPSSDKDSGYAFHPDLESLIGSLFREQRYRGAAVLDAQIFVINAVAKKVAVANLDGDALMNAVFKGEINRPPVLQVNEFASGPERDELTGVFFLFKGLVALRNMKAHSTALFENRERAFEYLALASLLLRILDDSTVYPERLRPPG
jgi:uncharacterized protein (TIGR02391 family)